MSETLYRLYNASGSLLYVGITNSNLGRFDGHARTKPWWREVAIITVGHFDTRGQVEAAEAALIATARPPHNTLGNPDKLCRAIKTNGRKCAAHAIKGKMECAAHVRPPYPDWDDRRPAFENDALYISDVINARFPGTAFTYHEIGTVADLPDYRVRRSIRLLEDAGFIVQQPDNWSFMVTKRAAV